MGIRVEWDNPEKTIVRQDYDEQWTWDEFSAAFKRTNVLVAEVDYRIGLIADTSAITRIPPNAIVSSARIVSRLPKERVLTVIIAPSPFVNSMIELISRIVRYEVRFASSVEQARAIIRSEIGAVASSNAKK